MSSTTSATRLAILEAAWDLLVEGEDGAQFRMQDVARAAGVSRQALYLHFENKTHLLICAAKWADREIHDIPGRIQPIFAATSAHQALERAVEFWAGFAPQAWPAIKRLTAVADTDDAARATMASRRKRHRAGIRRVLTQLARRDELRDEWTLDTATDWVDAMLWFGLWRDLVIARRWSKTRYIEHMTRMLEESLLRR